MCCFCKATVIMAYHCLISNTDAMLQDTGLWFHDLPLFVF